MYIFNGYLGPYNLVIFCLTLSVPFIFTACISMMSEGGDIET